MENRLFKKEDLNLRVIRAKPFLPILLLVLMVFFFIWFLGYVFEGEKPSINVEPLPEFLSGSEKFRLEIRDSKRGLKKIGLYLKQGEREIIVFEDKFPYRGLLNIPGVRKFHKELSINPHDFDLAQGRADLQVRVRDHSIRKGGDGNLSIFTHKMVVDTTPPTAWLLSKGHRVNIGGSGLVVYRTSSDTIKSGLLVESLFFPGFEIQSELKNGLSVCYFSIPNDMKEKPDLYLWAEDKAGNLSMKRIPYNLGKKEFRVEDIHITDRFLERILPYFSSYSFDAGISDIEKFIKINEELRRENTLALYNLRIETDPKQLWSGTWVRLKNAVVMGRFADQRRYLYNGRKIDESIHLGVDLASLANSKVPAANQGRVIFAGPLGMYGLTVVLDHGQGVTTAYSHLSKLAVANGQEVTKGEMIGLTGQTGLASGDHLHFSMMVNGVFVDPSEWWDKKWIQDNILQKLALLENEKN